MRFLIRMCYPDNRYGVNDCYPEKFSYSYIRNVKGKTKRLLRDTKREYGQGKMIKFYQMLFYLEAYNNIGKE